MSRLLCSLAILLLVSGSARSVPSCGKVTEELAPCLSYLQSSTDSKPSDACCEGVRDMNSKAKTKEDLIAICNCGKIALATIKYDPKRIPLLPKQCGVSLTLPPIDSHTDCSKAFGGSS